MPASTSPPNESDEQPKRSVTHGRWAGGLTREPQGRPKRWVIERRVGGGIRRKITLNASTEQEALVELALFTRDPIGYESQSQLASKAAHRSTARLDAETLGKFFEHSERRVREGALTALYVRQSLAPYLVAWGKALRQRELKQITLSEIKTHLSRWDTGRHNRIVALKAFTRWLREEDRLRREDDPTLDLKVLQPTPEKAFRRKGYPIDLVERLYAQLPNQLARDTVLLRCKAGLHDTEIDRIAQGEGVFRQIADRAGIEGTITFAHLKKGRAHVISVDAQAFAAAERMRVNGSGLQRTTLKRLIDAACARLGRGQDGEPIAIHPGELRHSFATWASTVGVEVHSTGQQGVDLGKVAEVMGHLSKRTTSLFYVGDRVPLMIALPVRLAHPDDPPVSGSAGQEVQR